MRIKMGDIMGFHASADEFVEQYKMTDTGHVYSNGIEYAPLTKL